MIKFRVYSKVYKEMKEFIQVVIKDGNPVNWLSSGGALMFPANSVLMIGIKIGDQWHFENDLYRDGGCYYSLCSGIYGWILNSINFGLPVAIEKIDWLEKVGHSWSKDEKIRELVKQYDPPVYSCLENIGRFSEVMR